MYSRQPDFNKADKNSTIAEPVTHGTTQEVTGKLTFHIILKVTALPIKENMV